MAKLVKDYGNRIGLRKYKPKQKDAQTEKKWSGELEAKPFHVRAFRSRGL